MNELVKKAYNFHNIQVDGSIINHEQILNIITKLSDVIEKNIDGDVVELGCYVGESSKYERKLLDLYNSNKELIVYDSFEGLPPLSEYEKNTGWKAGTLKTTEEVLTSNFINNGLKPPKIVKGWFKDIKDENLPEKICFAFLDGDFYDSIYDSLVKIYDRMSEGGIIMFHDYKRPDLPGVDAAIKDFFNEKNIKYDIETACDQLGYHIVKNTETVKNKNLKANQITLVTGLWDLGRNDLSEGWARDFKSHYLEKLKEFLQIPQNLIIFGDKEVQSFVETNKTHNNIQFIYRNLEWFRQQFFDEIQKIRTNKEWYSQKTWLSNSTQAKLEMYNPVVMQKMFLLNDARLMSKFNDSHMFWMDAGITNTVHKGYFTHDKVFDKVKKYFDKFSFICFPYDAEGEIHGFKYKDIVDISGCEVNKVARGGFFGGPKEEIETATNIYYSLMSVTLSKGLMGTEESLFSIMVHRDGDIFNYFEIESNGLLGKFFENLKNGKLIPKSHQKFDNTTHKPYNPSKVALYIITFNSPKQVKTLIESFYQYDRSFIENTNLYLLNNSTDKTTDIEYEEICKKYSMNHLRFEENLGICGGRQYIAEHFDKTDDEYMFFFEDDMFFYNGKDDKCKNGFVRYVDNIFKKSLNIIHKENYDFLKLSFTEFYGDNSVQWSWYNVPQVVREEYFPKNNRLPERGLDRNAPKVRYENIKNVNGLSYADGEVYYCNWPQIVSKEGNKKMFLTETWAHPFEQTWMSYIFQETVKGNIKPAILLASPIEHDRFEHYEKELRKES